MERVAGNLDFFNRLPNELIILVALLLDIDDLRSFRAVCRRFACLADCALAANLNLLCLTLTPESIGRYLGTCGDPVFSKRITSVLILSRPMQQRELDLPGAYEVFRHERPELTAPASNPGHRGRVLATYRLYFLWFFAGLIQLPKLAKLTYSVTFSPERTCFTFNPREIAGMTHEDDDWLAIRFVVEALRLGAAAGKTWGLQFCSPVMAGDFGDIISSLALVRSKCSLLASPMPFLRKIDLDTVWDRQNDSFSIMLTRAKAMATILNLATNLEHFSLRWAYGEPTPASLAVAVLSYCRWDNLKTLHLVRSKGICKLATEAVMEEDQVYTIDPLIPQSFLRRSCCVSEIYFRNLLCCGPWDDDVVVCDRELNSPALEPFRAILASLPLLTKCHVVLDSFSKIYIDTDGRLGDVDWDTEILGFWCGVPSTIAENPRDMSNVEESFDFGPWLLRPSEER